MWLDTACNDLIAEAVGNKPFALSIHAGTNSPVRFQIDLDGQSYVLRRVERDWFLGDYWVAEGMVPPMVALSIAIRELSAIPLN